MGKVSVGPLSLVTEYDPLPSARTEQLLAERESSVRTSEEVGRGR
jgi:hypothetical protein